MTRTWKVYGADGHRQRESFRESNSVTDYKGLKYEVLNSDRTGTNEYTIVKITGADADALLRALDGQICDGLFENCRVGRVEEVEA